MVQHSMSELILFSALEEMSNFIDDGKVNAKLMEFIEPIQKVEEDINIVTSSMKTSGKIMFIHGRPGVGKSTFLRSLSWRPHIFIRSIIEIDANNHLVDGLTSLFNTISSHKDDAASKRDMGPTCLVLNYLEHLDDFAEGDVKSFFRKLNGLLRNSPIFIVWPVTNRVDVEHMLQYSKDVSGTLFYRGKEVLNFPGPPQEKFKDIVLRTISVLNDGKELSEFGITFDDFSEVERKLNKLPQEERTIREYIELTKEMWRENSSYIESIRSKIPKSTEVWFIFSYQNAESIVSQFVRRSSRIEDNWSTVHDKFFEYIPNSQRSAMWTAKRLQMALYGTIKTRVLYLPTNALVSCVASYTENDDIIKIINENNTPQDWKDKYKAKRTLTNTPLYKQLLSEPITIGKRKGGPAAIAMEKASPIFGELVKWISGKGTGSDKEINKCIAKAITDATGIGAKNDKVHPWIPRIIPDIFVELDQKQICIEFHHTNRDEPGVIADYVLKKLNIYMNQLEEMVTSEGGR